MVDRETPEQAAERKRKQAERDEQVYSRRGGRSGSGWTQKDQREWDRKRHPAYTAGKRAGNDIGLGGSITSGKKSLLNA